MRVSQLAKKLNIPADTIRYYVRVGLLSPGRQENGYRVFDLNDCYRLEFIINTRQLGFSLSDIKAIFNATKNSTKMYPEIRELMELRLRETRVRYETLGLVRKQMQNAITEWRSLPNESPSGLDVTRLMNHLHCYTSLNKNIGDL